MLHRRSSSSSRHVSGIPERIGAAYPDYDRLPAHMSPDEVRACSRKIRQYTKGYRLAMLSNDWVLRGACRLHEAIAEGKASIDRMLEPHRRPSDELLAHLKANVATVNALIAHNARDVRALFSREAAETALRARPGLTRALFRKEILTKLQRRRLHAARLIEEIPIRFTKLKPIFDSYAQCARELKKDASQSEVSSGVADWKKVPKKRLFEFVSRSGMTPASVMKSLDRVDQRQSRRDFELHKLVLSNRRLIRSIAKKHQRKYAHMGLNLDDLEQGGMIGLMRAAVLFDPARGFTFGTYATWWIRNGVQRAALTASHFGDSSSRRERRGEVRDARRVLSHRYLREPTAEQIVEHLNEHPGSKFRYSPSNVWEALRRPVASIDQSIGADGKTVWKDTIADRRVGRPAAPDATLEAEDTRAALLRALQALSSREQQILLRRFGFHGGPPETLGDIGGSLGLTRERIRQIEQKALRKIKKRLYPKQIRGLLDSLES